ncbi:MAG: hypothetical protein K0R29_2241 [Pseudobdellovibrio sp.]|jgi:hypothetical protein|nr:hypothetical protein [Pseudobdellovibrio sp.]
MEMKASFVSFLQKKYPRLAAETLQNNVADQLLSPFQVKLSSAQIAMIKNEIKSYWKLRAWGEEKLADQYEKFGLTKPANYSVCMSYDFHINSDGKPELIEINTNAAFLAMGLEMYEYLNLPLVPGGFDENSLIKMFQQEAALAGRELEKLQITDDKPNEQRLYIEFLIYKELFNKHGITCAVTDSSEAEKLKDADLIYNRNTDFYFENNLPLRELFNRNKNFSPHSYEYFLLADKQRLLDWNEQSDIEKPSSLLPVFDLGKADKDQIWQQRKNLFIKPKNSFGSKQAYKAASISRKLFDEIYSKNFIAQQLSVPSEIDVNYQGQEQKLKYDLRCFAYQDELQLVIARLYQGQTTNLRTPGGGFAAITVE